MAEHQLLQPNLSLRTAEREPGLLIRLHKFSCHKAWSQSSPRAINPCTVAGSIKDMEQKQVAAELTPPI
ncbi:hypothetical protein ACDH70_00600 [Xanthomonas axonopodis pv. poinsettiicola]|uniref:hypothetical protein n=1 Tax=Xanthomonas axonopodis TaxID=53413 RepID=UPI0035591FCA